MNIVIEIKTEGQTRTTKFTLKEINQLKIAL